jgi:chromosome segregation ATPase
VEQPTCQYVAADGMRCARESVDGSFCADHTPEALERWRQRLAERDARRCSYVSNGERCAARAIEQGRCVLHAPETIERRAREEQARSADQATARMDLLSGQLEQLELSKTGAEAQLRALVSQSEEQKAQNRALEREARDLRAEQRRLRDLVKELEHKRAVLDGAPESSGAASQDAKAARLVARAVDLLSAPVVSEQDRLLAEACTRAAHEHRLWRATRRRAPVDSE